MASSVDLVRNLTVPLSPEPTGIEARVPRLEGIRAVIFDLYGTLLVSAAGEVGTFENGSATRAMEQAMSRAGPPYEELNPVELAADFETGIRRHRAAAREAGAEHPEVEIREVWLDVLRPYVEDAIPAETIEEIAIAYECIINPVSEMPGARKVLRNLEEKGLVLGLISNAQFYTEPVIEGVIGTDFSGLGFDLDCRILSFEIRAGKPSSELFEEMRGRLETKGIAPEEVFYLGNDLNKDVRPSAAVGFRSGLFAGDARSFRVGDSALEDALAEADAVITDLGQVLILCGVES